MSTPPSLHRYRSHRCADLRENHVGDVVRLSGWIARKRDHGKLLFIDLRDHYGLTQCVVDTDSPVFAPAEAARPESVICVTGRVVARAPETVNPTLDTGRVELRIDEFECLSPADTLPFQITEERRNVGEDAAHRYRYLYLRQEHMQRKLLLRAAVNRAIREEMGSRGFNEIQTPIITGASPEGARDFVIPSRHHAGRFYALPQAPQQFKQLLMVAGFDKYYQIAPCFRDEDTRADRTAEFYQLDVEMSFVTQEDVLTTMETILHGVFSACAPAAMQVDAPPFPRLAYADAMRRFGSDKPDLRNPLEIVDTSELFIRKDVEFAIFREQVQAGGVVRAIAVPGAATQPRRVFDRLNDWARDAGQAGLGYIRLEAAADGEGLLEGKGPIAKFLSSDALGHLANMTGAGAGDALFFVAGQEATAAEFAGKVRTKLGTEFDLIAAGGYRFCWIVDFPFYARDGETGRLDFGHNPFSMPQGGLAALNGDDPDAIMAFQYDFVCNGYEAGSGAIRNNRPDIMLRAFELAGYGAEEVANRFGGMLNAFRYGAPPHGGIAFGIDRMVMLLAGEGNIREVGAFPLMQSGQDPLMQAPSDLTPERLRELHIRLRGTPAATAPAEATPAPEAAPAKPAAT